MRFKIEGDLKDNKVLKDIIVATDKPMASYPKEGIIDIKDGDMGDMEKIKRAGITIEVDSSESTIFKTEEK